MATMAVEVPDEVMEKSRERKLRTVVVATIVEDSSWVVTLPPPLPPELLSAEHSQTNVAAFHLRSWPVEQPFNKVRRSPEASRPELVEVVVVVAPPNKIELPSMKPVEEVRRILEEPAIITPARSTVPVALIANCEEELV